MPLPLFLIFSALMLGFGIAVVALRNPVSCALALVVSFVSLAALFIGLDAYFIGIIQILVYAGAVMVLFLFIIMLLDIKAEAGSRASWKIALGGVALAFAVGLQVMGVLSDYAPGKRTLDQVPLQNAAAAAHYQDAPSIAKDLNNGRLPDVKLVGHKLFTEYNFHLQMVAVLLTIATLGVVVLSRKDTPPVQVEGEGGAEDSDGSIEATPASTTNPANPDPEAAATSAAE